MRPDVETREEVVALEEQGASTSKDDAILRAQGHEPAMPRSFSLLSALGLAFSITNTWVGYLTSFGQNLRYAGRQSVVFGVLVGCVFQWLIVLGMAELASAFPSSGGQYHFTYIVAPKKYKRFAAFVVGWLSVIGWWLIASAGVSLASTSIIGLASFSYPSFEVKQWMQYVAYLVVIVITVSPLFLFPRFISVLTTASLYLTISGFIVSLITVLAARPGTELPASVLLSTEGNTSGWGTSTAWVLGITNAMFCFGGTDGALHIAEEMTNPAKKLPLVLNITMAIAITSVFPLFVVLMLKMTDPIAVTSSNLPAATLLYQATGSKNLTLFLMSWVIIVLLFAAPCQWVSCGRMTWAFAREGGLPFSEVFSRINRFYQFPVNATLAAVIFTVVYGVLYLLSTTAFNSIITSAVMFLNLSYCIPQGILIVEGRDKCLTARPFRLGRFGWFCNLFSILWIVVWGVLVCFPPQLPAMSGSMNYTSAVLVGLFVLIMIFWWTTGRKFRGPKVDLSELDLHMQ